MKTYKLKRWVMPTIYIGAVSIVLLSLTFVAAYLKEDPKAESLSSYVSESVVKEPTIKEEVKEVIEPTNETVNHPYLNQNVKTAKNYYDDSADEETQMNSLIYYHNTYMENTGILYTSDEVFDVVSVLDGKVTSVTKDEILGNVIEVMHSNELVTIYHCLGEVFVKDGDEVKQNDVLGKSGEVNIDDGYENALLFEVNYKGSLMNPIEFYNIKKSDLVG